MATKPKRPRDTNQLAKLIVDIATGEQTNPLPKNTFAQEQAAYNALNTITNMEVVEAIRDIITKSPDPYRELSKFYEFSRNGFPYPVTPCLAINIINSESQQRLDLLFELRRPTTEQSEILVKYAVHCGNAKAVIYLEQQGHFFKQRAAVLEVLAREHLEAEHFSLLEHWLKQDSSLQPVLFRQLNDPELSAASRAWLIDKQLRAQQSNTSLSLTTEQVKPTKNRI